MKIRIKPRELEISEGEPFRDDLLDREVPIDILSNIVGSIEGPCVLAVNAAWGTGKTTFLRMWSRYLRDENFPVVEFNAWETDFSRDPFVAISAELTDELKKYVSKSNIDKIKKVAGEIARLVPKAITREIIAKTPVVQRLKEEELAQLFGSYTDDRLSEYKKGKDLIQDFKEVLGNSAKTLSDSENGKPLVVFIDELDRCRPSYAIELLEVAKHLFTVDNIVFVLGVNLSQLAHSIKVFYGGEFDAEGYLQRFFDIEYTLPFPERKDFINRAVESIQIEEYLGDDFEDCTVPTYKNIVSGLLESFFDIQHLSLRTVEQAVHHLGLALASLPRDKESLMVPSTVLLIIRTIDPDLYKKFLNDKDITDSYIVEEIFKHNELENLRYHSHWGNVFEAMIIVTFVEREGKDRTKSSLLRLYDDLLKNGQETDPLYESYEKIIELFEFFQTEQSHEEKDGFNYCVECIELTHTNLKYDAR